MTKILKLDFEAKKKPIAANCLQQETIIGRMPSARVLLTKSANKTTAVHSSHRKFPQATLLETLFFNANLPARHRLACPSCPCRHDAKHLVQICFILRGDPYSDDAQVSMQAQTAVREIISEAECKDIFALQNAGIS